jgi:hypothetical protein
MNVWEEQYGLETVSIVSELAKTCQLCDPSRKRRYMIPFQIKYGKVLELPYGLWKLPYHDRSQTQISQMNQFSQFR